MSSWALSPAEQRRLDEEGYLVREAAFRGAELEAIREACEALCRRLVGSAATSPAASPRIPAGSYLFQLCADPLTMLKWEPDHPEVLQGVEPFAHFDEALRRLGCDPRLVEPMRGLIGAPEIELFTEKLNLKRGRVGGPIVLHQDYPYWTQSSEHPEEIATAVLFLDDAHAGNGGLEVLPGSHRGGPRLGGAKPGFGRNELKPESVSDDELVLLEVPAGTLVCFGSLLVHRSLPNASDTDRRTLLYSYQPAGRLPSIHFFEKLLRR
jgi:phytanoyl-CoA dioxygenase PhyH